MAIFYRPPEPVQAVPKVLPRTPGSEPPRIGPLGGSSAVLAAVGMWAAAAAVPMPTQKPLNVVALTLTYGAQPPRVGQLTGANNTAEMTAILASYPQPGEPRLTPALPLTVAPLTLKYGSQPSAAPPLSNGNAAATLASWPPAGEPRLPAVFVATPSAAWNIPPVNAPRPHTPYPLSVWPAPSWPQQAQLGTAAWNVPVISSSYVPPSIQPPSILQAWYHDPIVIVWVAGGAGLPAGGDNPPPVTPYPFAAVLQWGITWPAQSEADGAAWNFIPPVVSVPPPRVVSPTVAVFAWQPPPPLPARPVTVAPLTLRYGQQPPPGPAFAVATALAVAQQWPAVWWPGQSAAPVAPLTLVYGQRPPVIGVRVPAAALLAWYPDWGTQRYPPMAAELVALLGIPPQQGINHIAFDASVTVAVTDSLITVIFFDSLTTKSVFDG